MKKLILLALILSVVTVCGCSGEKKSTGNNLSVSSSESENTLSIKPDKETSAPPEVSSEIPVSSVASSAENAASIPEQEDYSNYAGEYSVAGTSADVESGLFVSVTEAKKDSVVFIVSYIGRNASPIYESDRITVKPTEGKADFYWKDSWENEGTGSIAFNDGKLYLTMKVTKEADINRASLDTNGVKEFVRQ